MERSASKLDTNWKREWEEEEILTPEERTRQKQDQEEHNQIYREYLECLAEANNEHLGGNHE